MELLADRRIELDARPAPAVVPVLEVVFIGHCPPDDRPARWDRLGSDARLLEEIGALGYRAQVERLRAWAAGTAAPSGDGDEALARLFRLPVPVYSLGQFQDLFPGVFDGSAAYTSRLAGDRAWLPLAVQDFFDQPGPLPDGSRKLWVIRVPESEGRSAFLPAASASLLDIEALGAFERALLIPRAGILALPDFERLQVPAELPDIPRVRLENPLPEFLPCSVELDDTHRERRHGDEVPSADQPLTAGQVVPGIARALARHRPDMQCLMAVPFDAEQQGESPRPSADFLDRLSRIGGTTPDAPAADEGYGELAGKLRHLQFVYPYLRGPDRLLGSPCGLVAGMQADVSQRSGPWRSAAGRPLPGHALPWPPVTQQQATAWRDAPGLTILLDRKGRGEIDDERLAASVLHPEDTRRLPPEKRRADHLRSAEVMRFMGWLRRELQGLGERLAFDADVRDPRPGIALRSFFDRLHRLGALRGKLPEQAYSLVQRSEGESTLVFEIEVAPAFPIDRIRVTFQHNRHADGGTQVEVQGG